MISMQLQGISFMVRPALARSLVHKDRLAEMRPFMGGGDMIREVSKEAVTYNDPPMKFEAGTPGIVQTIGLGVALKYMMDVGMEAISAHEADLAHYTQERLSGLNWLNVQGHAPGKAAIFSFTMDGAAHAHDISNYFGQKGRCRAGWAPLCRTIDGTFRRHCNLPGVICDV